MTGKRTILFYLPIIILMTLFAGTPMNAQEQTERLLYPVDEGGLWGYIDNTGSMVIQPQFEGASHFSEGLAEVGINGKAAFIDTTGKVVFTTNFNYGSVEMFSEGLAAVYDQNGWGFIDRTGRVVVRPQYSNAQDFACGLAVVRTGDWAEGTAGYVDVTGKLVIPMNFYDGRPFSEGLAAVLRDGRWGFIGMTGDYVIDPQFVDVGIKYSEGLIPVEPEDQEGNLWGYINDVGEYVIEPRFNNAGPFSDGLAPVQMEEGDPFGFINKQGVMVIPPTYYALTTFFDGLATVFDDSGQMGYINTSGALVIPLQFTQASIFRDGLAVVTNWSENSDPTWGYIDKRGTWVWGPVTGYWPE